ncbi:MAG: hypothetical protein RLN72_14715, partial [Henriciella sp.]
MPNRLLGVCLFLLAGLTACGPTPHPDQPELSELYAAAPRGPLPDGVRPVAYDVDLTIDPRASYFGGTVVLTIDLDQPATGFWVHGQGLEIRGVEIRKQGFETAGGSWRDVLEPGVAWVGFERRMPAGELDVEISYRAPFDLNLAGLFKVVEQGDAYALAKSESIQARRFMPGFDEPRFKAPFDVTLTIPEGNLAITNTPVAEEVAADPGFRTLRFEETRPLPTYLLSLAVGPFDEVEAPALLPNDIRAKTIHLKGYTRRGKGSEIEYALQMTEPMVTFFEEALEVPYPYRKLDIIAAPQWPSGATELAAAITYRESR